MKPRALRLLVMHVSLRCDQACAHCSIWRGNGKGTDDLGVRQRLSIIREAHALGARSILFTGGEPLLCDHIETLAREAHHLGFDVQIATNGLGLSGAAAWLGECVNEIYVSVEGPADLHDAIRGRGMFARLEVSLAGILTLSHRPRLIGRSVITARNAALLDETVQAARSLGLDALSFLPFDSTSGAFGGDPLGREHLRPGPVEALGLKEAVARLAASMELGSFVVEDAKKLNAFADAFLAAAGNGFAPACDAPEWSSVVEADGRLRPCFFQPPVPRDAGSSLGEARESRDYAAALSELGRGNAICKACVCPKYLGTGVGRLGRRLGAAISLAIPRLHQRAGSPA